MIRWFVHPDDPDGFPGKGSSAVGNDIDLVHREDGSLAAIYVTGGRSRVEFLRRIDPFDGSYTGFSIPLWRSGGSISGVLLDGFVPPGAPGGSPRVTALVDSKAEIAVLDGTEPAIGEVLGFQVQVDGSSARLSWRGGSAYDRVDLYRDCRLLASFDQDPGEALDEDLSPGVYRYHLEARLNGLVTSTDELLAVIGEGRCAGSSRTTDRTPGTSPRTTRPSST